MDGESSTIVEFIINLSSMVYQTKTIQWGYSWEIDWDYGGEWWLGWVVGDRGDASSEMTGIKKERYEYMFQNEQYYLSVFKETRR